MFKARLIENDTYYHARRRQLGLMLLPSVLIGVLVNAYHFPVWVTLGSITAYIAVVLLTLHNQRILRSLTGSQHIILNDTGIHITRTRTPDTSVSFDINPSDTIIVPPAYTLPRETLADMGRELAGKPSRHYLILRQNGEERRFEFEVDTHYMIRQLQQVITGWVERGYQVRQV